MCLSIVFIILDLLAVTPAIDTGVINPFWKIATVFKCFTDTIILDDFKTALDRLSRRRFEQFMPQDDYTGRFLAPNNTKWPAAYLDRRPGSVNLAHIEHTEAEFDTMNLIEEGIICPLKVRYPSRENISPAAGVPLGRLSSTSNSER